MSVKARHDASYFITFIDDFMPYDHIYLISHKFKALNYFKLYLNEVKIYLRGIQSFKDMP